MPVRPHLCTCPSPQGWELWGLRPTPALPGRGRAQGSVMRPCGLGIPVEVLALRPDPGLREGLARPHGRTQNVGAAGSQGRSLAEQAGPHLPGLHPGEGDAWPPPCAGGWAWQGAGGKGDRFVPCGRLCPASAVSPSFQAAAGGDSQGWRGTEGGEWWQRWGGGAVHLW